MRLAASVQRNILSLINKTNFSNREIAQRLGLHHGTVSIVRKKILACGIDYEKLIVLDDNTLKLQLGTSQKKKLSLIDTPDWQKVQKEMQLRDVTLSLLWVEHKVSLDKQENQCISYSQFCRQYKSWLKSQRISMRQFHKPGEKMFVDFCGKTIPIFNSNSGEVTVAQVFVAVLGASGYMFAVAVPSQKIKDWIHCHIKAFEFFGGTSQQIVPDNLKSAVIKHTSKEIILNKAYVDMADYYDIIINPARSKKPKDKSLAEVGVQIVQRWALAPLRHRKFFSVDELNTEIEQRLEILNNKTSKKYKQSRQARFIELEQASLQALPLEPYEVAEWKYNIRIPDDYHVQYNKHFYSVPYQHRHQLIDLRITHNIIEVLLSNKRIASHILCEEIGQTTEPSHMPLEHRHFNESDPEMLLKWAEDIGPNTYEWVRQNLQERRDYINGVKSASKLRRWTREEQNHDRLESACKFALSINEKTFQRLQNIIRSNSDLRLQSETNSWIKAHENVRGRNYYSTGA